MKKSISLLLALLLFILSAACSDGKNGDNSGNGSKSGTVEYTMYTDGVKTILKLDNDSKSFSITGNVDDEAEFRPDEINEEFGIDIEVSEPITAVGILTMSGKFETTGDNTVKADADSFKLKGEFKGKDAGKFCEALLEELEKHAGEMDEEEYKAQKDIYSGKEIDFSEIEDIGKRIMVLNLNDSDKTAMLVNYEDYNKDGKITTKEEYDSDGFLVKSSHYEEGKLVNTFEYWPNTSEKDAEYVTNKEKARYFYDTDGNIYEGSEYDIDGNEIKSYREDGSYYEYFYDSEGNQTSWVHKDKDGNRI